MTRQATHQESEEQMSKNAPSGRVPRNQPDPKPGGPRIVINPTTFHNKKDALCVAFNEGFRIVMDDIGFNPAAEPTPEQRDFFADTAYADDEVQLRRTILARVCTLDTSIPHPTDDQLEESVEFLGTVLDLGVCQNKWEENCVRRLMNLMAHVPQRGAGVEPPRDASALQGDVGGGATDDDDEKNNGAAVATETDSNVVEVEQVEGYAEPEHSADEGSSGADNDAPTAAEIAQANADSSAAAAQATAANDGGQQAPATGDGGQQTAAQNAQTNTPNAQPVQNAPANAPNAQPAQNALANTPNEQQAQQQKPMINHATERTMTKYEQSSFEAQQRGRAAMERGKGGIAAADQRHAAEKAAIKTMRGYSQSSKLHRIEDGLSGSPGHRLSDPITPLNVGKSQDQQAPANTPPAQNTLPAESAAANSPATMTPRPQRDAARAQRDEARALRDAKSGRRDKKKPWSISVSI